jgi:hypothetical protein
MTTGAATLKGKERLGTGVEVNTDRVQRLEAPEAIKDNLITGNGGIHVLTPPRRGREST